jgi:hypothetical protein
MRPLHGTVGFPWGKGGSDVPTRFPCGVRLLIVGIYLQHAGMLYIDSSTYVLVIYGLLTCSSSCYYTDNLSYSILTDIWQMAQ